MILAPAVDFIRVVHGMTLPPEKEFYTAAELAQLLAVSKKTVDRLVAGGALPVHQIGRVRRFRRDDVEALLAGARHRVSEP